MLKLIGAVMIFGSCAALGLSARQNLRRRVAAADEELWGKGNLYRTCGIALGILVILVLI